MSGKRVFLGAVGGAAVFAVSWFVPAGVLLLLDAMLRREAADANIGAGLLLLAIPAAVVPLGLWALLRRLGVPGAAVIGAGGIVVYVATVMVSTEQAVLDPLYLTGAIGTGAFLIYAGLAAVLAGAIAGRRNA
ncbi:hypothetical protein J2S43_006234 [Catenuloplanes nepalensis]|uniref:Uncharacterized protein n=1 Tax=Catenuloplanes nepalensis TaxID=587533 RepID=A0ABT9N203_9ACTN|nr:hypothetical protein [Catenuloplanes nepalensis]MDP9797722.1 hypothetical protein [Catenuloplanes nepalensis]